MLITSQQSRMARAALGLSIDKLADLADVRSATVSNFERGGECYRSTVEKLQRALEDAGVMFIENGGVSASGGIGVRLRG